MAVEKFRRKASFADGATFAGSVSFAGQVAMNATQIFSTAPVFNVPITAPTGSANTQIAGYLRINSGAVSATQSTTRLNSGALVFLSTVLVGAAVSSYGLTAPVVVTTVAQAASGGYFTAGFIGGVAIGASADVCWFIINPA